MDLESFIKQIGHLEELNRKEKCKLNEEITRHKSTLADLEKTQNENLKMGESLQKVKKDNSCLQTQVENQEKIISQLKSSLKNAKNDYSLMKESCEKDMADFRLKREEFTITLDGINQSWRTILAEWKEKGVNQSYPTTLSTDICMKNAQALSASIDQPIQTSEAPQVAPQVEDESKKRLEEIGTEMDRLLEEEERLSKELAGLEAELKLRQEENQNMRAEFAGLDEYTTNLQKHYDVLNKVVSDPQICPLCGTKFNIHLENPQNIEQNI